MFAAMGLTSQSAPKIAAAQVLLAQVQSQRDELKRQLELALQQAALGLKTTRQALELSERQNTLAQENLRLARKSFEQGEINLLDLIQVQTRAFMSEHAFKQWEIELQRYIAKYNQAAGIIS